MTFQLLRHDRGQNIQKQIVYFFLVGPHFLALLLDFPGFQPACQPGVVKQVDERDGDKCGAVQIK